MSDRAMQVCETHLYAEKEQVCPWCRIRELEAKVERLEAIEKHAEAIASAYVHGIGDIESMIVDMHKTIMKQGAEMLNKLKPKQKSK